MLEAQAQEDAAPFEHRGHGAGLAQELHPSLDPQLPHSSQEWARVPLADHRQREIGFELAQLSSDLDGVGGALDRLHRRDEGDHRPARSPALELVTNRIAGSGPRKALEIDSVGDDGRGYPNADQAILGVLAVGKHLARPSQNLALDPPQRTLEEAIATG